MEYVYAALMLHKAGKYLSRDNIRSVLDAAGTTVNDDKIKELQRTLDDIGLHDVIGCTGDDAGPCIYAALILNELGRPISQSLLQDVLNAAGVAMDTDRVAALQKALQEVDMQDAISDAEAASDSVQTDNDESTDNVTEIFYQPDEADTEIFEPSTTDDT